LPLPLILPIICPESSLVIKHLNLEMRPSDETWKKNISERLEEIEVIENFCGLLKQKNQKDKCVQFYEELAGLPNEEKIPMKTEKV